jgi:hypothetical protein|tara:strand:+ start:1646 stop:2221 length:576 start_codon:yes stop_codon:yes gene_type:complete
MALTHNKVQVSPDKQGNVIRVSTNNPKYAHIRVTQNVTKINSQGWVNKKQLSALLHGELEDLQELGFNIESELPGNIVVLESFEGRTEDLKIAGETGVRCKGVDKVTGEVRDIYRTTRYDATGRLEDDVIPHVNGDEIRNSQSNNNITQTELEKVMEKGSKTKSKKQDKEETPVEEPQEQEVEMEEETFEL